MGEETKSTIDKIFDLAYRKENINSTGRSDQIDSDGRIRRLAFGISSTKVQ